MPLHCICICICICICVWLLFLFLDLYFNFVCVCVCIYTLSLLICLPSELCITIPFVIVFPLYCFRICICLSVVFTPCICNCMFTLVLIDLNIVKRLLGAAMQCSYILNIHIFLTESSSEFQTGFSLEIVSRLSIAKFSKLNPVRNSKLDLV